MEFVFKWGWEEHNVDFKLVDNRDLLIEFELVNSILFVPAMF